MEVLKKTQKRHHPSIHAGEKDWHPPPLHPLGSQETEGRPSEHQKLMLTILTVIFWFFSAGKKRQQQQNGRKKKQYGHRKFHVCVFDMLPILFYRCFLYLLMCMVLICFEYQSI